MASALKNRVVDKMWVFVAPRILGGGAREAVGDLGVTRLDRALSLYGVRWRRVGEDFLVEGYPPSRKGNRECLPDWLRKSESSRP